MFFYFLWTFFFLFFVAHEAKDIDAVILPQSKKSFYKFSFRLQGSESITDGGEERRGIA